MCEEVCIWYAAWRCLASRQAMISPFLFVCGDDRVIRYTGANVDTGGAEDAQMAE
ncbi:hypothetical protein DEO72_LG9g829 [Vigna unguiculata]|uniref:Uncharacterized protein n=1 Tax=Vigna unguiculata TaxID=3917 RepID=A0A4D6MWL1_VIGUN|nr:hypothetical protein DEO72_LG9g829 [Vigna unguiculata]